MRTVTEGKLDGRGHFFAAAAEAMRRILVDRARDKRRLKRHDERRKLDWSAIDIAIDTPSEDLLALDELLEQLVIRYPSCAELVKLRFFAGMSQRDAAATLDIPRRTAIGTGPSPERGWAGSCERTRPSRSHNSHHFAQISGATSTYTEH